MGVGKHNDDIEGYTGRSVYAPFPLKPPFKVGDIVYLKSGHAPQKVLEIKTAPRNVAGCGYVMRCGYVRWFDASDSLSKRWRTCDDYLLYEGDPTDHDYNAAQSRISQSRTKKENPGMAKLYQTVEDKPRFGTFLAKNSTGQIVLEMKDGGPTNIEAFDPEAVEEVRPYTIAISVDGRLDHFEAVKGTVNEGDVVISERGIIGVVVKINTGHPNSVPKFRGRRVVTEEIGTGE